MNYNEMENMATVFKIEGVGKVNRRKEILNEVYDLILEKQTTTDKDPIGFYRIEGEEANYEVEITEDEVKIEIV